MFSPKVTYPFLQSLGENWHREELNHFAYEEGTLTEIKGKQGERPWAILVAHYLLDGEEMGTTSHDRSFKLKTFKRK